MNQVLNRVRDVDPNDSETVKEATSAFFQNLYKNKDFNSIRWLRTLENVINRFPKYCGSHRPTIEHYLTHFLNANNYFIVIEAAKCAHALQQVRAPQDKGATAKSSWRDQMSSLCEAALTLIDASSVNTINIYKNSKSQNKNQKQTNAPLQAALLEIDTVTNTPEAGDKNTVLCTRLRNIFVFMQAMLVEIYPVAKPIRPQLILEVILKALSSSGNRTSTEITIVKVQALKTLDALVACLGSNLIPFSTLVFRFVMQTLRWSSENISEESRKVRSTAYSSLTKWLTVLHTHRPSDGRTRWDEELTSHIVGDVTPPKHIIQLTASTQSMKNLSKKARKRLANTLLKESNISSHMPGEKNKITMSEESNDEITIAALECAESFLTVCGIFLKPVVHKQFQELLVRESYNLHSYSPQRSLALLRALEASRKCGANVAPPSQYCLQLYSVLVNSTDREISKFCSNALLDIRLHLHCSPPSLNFALEAQPDSKKETKRKHMSERNRAVLESLLGKERMPSENLREEVITIPDEPSHKKQKTDDISEQISLSSDDTIDSIEISDDNDDAPVIQVSIEETRSEIDQNDVLNIEPVVEMALTEENEPSDVEIDEHDAPTQLNDKTTQIPKVIETINIEIDVKTNNTPKEIVTVDLDEIPNEDVHKNLKLNIYEAQTQLPLYINVSSEDAIGEKSPISMEVAYDYPNTGQTVKVLENLDDENLPSTNDTDDIQITCGQVVKGSQDDWNKKEVNEKINGDKTPDHIFQNGVATDVEKDIGSAKELNKNDTKIDGVTVEDMLADFVDEVAEDNLTQSLTQP